MEIYSEYRDATKTDDKKEDIADDIEFEIELIKQITVNIDYILELIEKALDSSLELRGKKDLIMDFITTINPSSDVRGEFIKFTNKKKLEELNRIIEEENLDRYKTLTLIKRAYKNAIVEILGTEIVELMPKMSIFSKQREESKERVTIRLVEFFEKFYTISNGEF
ncbi:hypothetical protein KDE12_00160 [Campylobacter sp. faydin G-105]|nr:hypothetical protein [Campylobacter anatolicus]MBR8461268.1 hypothetical protein [Campylobacter anatolicus]